jgi:hypothetical protein
MAADVSSAATRCPVDAPAGPSAASEALMSAIGRPRRAGEVHARGTGARDHEAARCSGRSVRRSANRPSATGVQTWGNGGVAEAAQNVLHPFGGRPSALPAALRRGSRIAYPGLTCTIRPTPDATPALRQAASRRLPASRTATAAAREGRSLPPVRRRETVRAPPEICGLCRALP